MTKENQTELLLCPFCGGKPKQLSHRGSGRVICSNKCQYQQSMSSQKWNTRAPVSPQPLDIEALKHEMIKVYEDKIEKGEHPETAAGGINLALNHLFATGRLNPVPDGWVLVPKEPTEAMIEEIVTYGCEKWRDGSPFVEKAYKNAPLFYRAMIAAAHSCKENAKNLTRSDNVLSEQTCAAPKPTGDV